MLVPNLPGASCRARYAAACAADACSCACLCACSCGHVLLAPHLLLPGPPIVRSPAAFIGRYEQQLAEAELDKLAEQQEKAARKAADAAAVDGTAEAAAS